MKIEDFEIEIRKYDDEKNVVYVNLIVQKELEIRGFVVRYTTTKKSPINPVWILNPPSVKSKNRITYFWIVRLNNMVLWGLLKKKILEKVISYTNLL